MKRIFYSVAIMFFLFSCQGLEEEKHLPQAEVSFSTLSLQQFNTHSEQARTQASAWEHVFAEEVEMLITNNESGEAFTLVFDPNDFFLPRTIMLPYGEYTYVVESAGEEEEFSSYLPFIASGSFQVSSPNINISLNAETTFGLVTVKNKYVESATLSNRDMRLTDDETFYYIYLLNRHESWLRVRDINDMSTEWEITLDPYMHLHYFLRPEGGNIEFRELNMGEFEYIPEGIALDDITNIVYDNDGNRYRTVRIGNQTWMAENLRSTTFCNGEEIPFLEGTEAWIELEEPVWTYYDNDESYNHPYGKLYNGFTAIDERNPCPCGWKVPSQEDLLELIEGRVYNEFKATGFDYWVAPNHRANNSTGFSMVGSGIFVPLMTHFRGEEFFYIGQYGHYGTGFNFLRRTANIWSTTREMSTSWGYEVLYILYMGAYGEMNVAMHDGPLREGLSIRCLKVEEAG
ncbi:fibrobacter succinogenes major paralogous domain-containing protein [Litoribacter populi]|uniref:fibrobacter succinogenes major paralogous domain-containing protein n=1 Tax=Litoribacter populi TaxID=2598460 RepID=UPI00117DAB8A|nr:fibrobacter succinogenes major paralogous domain-containing protein [Litoribacter populi]